ncbi:MAG: co-chaperone GroES [Planctomycetes bacterium]|nr:co-chaperone GroES [Planctomycetota bacterium]
MKIRPINAHVLLKPLQAADKSPGGIYLPDTAKERQNHAKVIAVAEDATEEVAVGDEIIYKEFRGTEVKMDGEDYVLLSSEDLLVKRVAADEIPD